MSALDTRENKIVVTFLAYRDWAIRAIDKVSSISNVEVMDIIRSESEYRDKVLKYPNGYVDVIVLVGWSWIIKDDTLNRFRCVGVHPSDLPMYRGGSPIQHQIIDGLDRTRISLMTISPDGVDVGDIWLKEDWDLSGSTMQEILDDLMISTAKLLNSFFFRFFELKPQKQFLDNGTYYKRRKPSESRVTWDMLSSMSLKESYNLIRALGDPYPNIYVEDTEGNRLFIKEAEYQSAQDILKDAVATDRTNVDSGNK